MSFLKCLTLLALVAALDAARFQCDYTFYKDAGGYIKFQEMPLKFDEAKQRCALEEDLFKSHVKQVLCKKGYYKLDDYLNFLSGSILASPINDGIKAVMICIMNTSKVDCSKQPLNTAVFTGISKKYNSYGIFSSVEGIRLSEIPHTWAPGEPDNYIDEENCIAMQPDGTMADVKCDKPLPHFCFLKEVRAKTLNACGPKNKDYTLDTTTGSCYKFHDNTLVHDEAAEACNEEGGHLLIINDDTEAQVVRKLSPDFPITNYEKHVLIGFKLHNNTGEWMTLQGETIEEAGYDKWDQGEPNNERGQENCGGVKLKHAVSTLILNDISCHQKHEFICEKDPEILLCK